MQKKQNQSLSDFFPDLDKIHRKTYPFTVNKPKRTPIKCQGIKTRLISFISSNINWNGKGKWIEGFLGSGIVLFNIAPREAIVSDINPHIIGFYNALKRGENLPTQIKDFLSTNGRKLKEIGESHYYEMRDQFNETHNPLIFIFLTKTCFNGLMRFNTSGDFNAPFCKNTRKLSKDYIKKIVSQIKWVNNIIHAHNYTFLNQGWNETTKLATEKDYIYLDPPYSGRDTGYFIRWNQDNDDEIISFLTNTKTKTMISTWKEDDKLGMNPFFKKARDVSNTRIEEKKHYYRVGAKNEWRDEVIEALVIKDQFKKK